jgi:murein DD-endopeptidase MepM/ murein hydrolase activator NlpD
MKRSVIAIITLLIVGSITGSAVAATITKTLAWPSDTKTLMLPFGYVFPRANPRRYRNLIHFVDTGIDIAAPANSPVYAAEAGTVKAIYAPSVTTGITVGIFIIEHTDASNNTYTTLYIGADVVSPLAVGDTVIKGQYIATMQDMGAATALHFAIRNAPYGDGVLAGASFLPTIASSGLPAFPESFINPVSVLQ